jgi:carboxymethylenebutenolidase
MLKDASVNHVLVMTGGFGKSALCEFYSIHSKHASGRCAYIGYRTVGENQLVDEMMLSFTHTPEMPWTLSGIAPTNRRVEIPLVAIVRFRDGKLAHEHIYWDQASVLKQIGLLMTRPGVAGAWGGDCPQSSQPVVSFRLTSRNIFGTGAKTI